MKVKNKTFGRKDKAKEVERIHKKVNEFRKEE